MCRLSTRLLMASVFALLCYTLANQAQGQQANPMYSCGVDQPTGKQCARRVSDAPLTCTPIVDRETGVTSYACVERKKTASMVSMVE